MTDVAVVTGAERGLGHALTAGLPAESEVDSLTQMTVIRSTDE